MASEEMGKVTNRLRLAFAVSSVVFVLVLAISPFQGPAQGMEAV